MFVESGLEVVGGESSGTNFLVPKTTLIVYPSGYSRKYETICTRVGRAWTLAGTGKLRQGQHLQKMLAHFTKLLKQRIYARNRSTARSFQATPVPTTPSTVAIPCSIGSGSASTGFHQRHPPCPHKPRRQFLVPGARYCGCERPTRDIRHWRTEDRMPDTKSLRQTCANHSSRKPRSRLRAVT
jgi:hypothetical protein